MPIENKKRVNKYLIGSFRNIVNTKQSFHGEWVNTNYLSEVCWIDWPFPRGVHDANR